MLPDPDADARPALHALGITLAHDERNTTLIETLRLAVPLYIQQLRGAAPHDLVRTGLRAASSLGSRGDLLQFTTPRRTGSQRAAVAEAFEALARGLAALTVHHGELTFAGLHWCTIDHPHCPHRSGPADTAR